MLQPRIHEKCVAPEKIIVTRFDASGAVVRQRPVCPFPAQAAYKGRGDINDAKNFSCVTPELKERSISKGDIVLIQNSLRQRDLKLPNRVVVPGDGRDGDDGDERGARRHDDDD